MIESHKKESQRDTGSFDRESTDRGSLDRESTRQRQRVKDTVYVAGRGQLGRS